MHLIGFGVILTLVDITINGTYLPVAALGYLILLLESREKFGRPGRPRCGASAPPASCLFCWTSLSCGGWGPCGRSGVLCSGWRYSSPFSSC